MSKDTVQQIQDNIKAAKEFVEMDKALERLESNRDFVAVITEGYLKKESIRLVHLKADPAMQTAERQTSILASIDAIGGLLHYFRTVGHNAQVALKSIAADELEIEELQAEELGK